MRIIVISSITRKIMGTGSKAKTSLSSSSSPTTTPTNKNIIIMIIIAKDKEGKSGNCNLVRCACFTALRKRKAQIAESFLISIVSPLHAASPPLCISLLCVNYAMSISQLRSPSNRIGSRKPHPSLHVCVAAEHRQQAHSQCRHSYPQAHLKSGLGRVRVLPTSCP